MTDQPPEYESVRILRLQPGDTIVVRLAYEPSRPVIHAVKAQLEPKFPGHEILVLGPNEDIEIVRTDQPDRLNDPTPLNRARLAGWTFGPTGWTKQAPVTDPGTDT